MNKRNVIWFLAAGFLYLTGFGSPIILAQQTKKLFTVADEIGLAHFGEEGEADAVRFSPDGSYVAAHASRGQLDLNRVEGSLRFYRSADIGHFLEHSDESQPPNPVWVVNRSAKERSSIGDWRWLPDSSGVAFLERTVRGNKRLVLADLRKKTVEPLSSAMETVNAFDIRDRRHYVYTIDTLIGLEKRQAERQAPAIVGTGRSIYELLFPDDPIEVTLLSGRRYLWAVVGGKRFEVKNDGAPVVSGQGNGTLDWSLSDLALSPDGRSVVTTLSVAAPASWETLYPPGYASDPYRIHAGKNAIGGTVRQYVHIDLQTGSLQVLTGAPIAADAGWWAGGPDRPSWSGDGQAVLLPGTFLVSKDHTPSRPCVAVVDLPSNTCTCVQILKGKTETGVEEGYHENAGVRFAGGDKQRVMVTFYSHRLDYRSLETTEYWRMADGTWKETGQTKGVPGIGATQIDRLLEVEHDGLKVAVKQGLNESPRLVATNKEASRVIWDPNPQLKNLNLGRASVYRWKDKEGKEWKGGLFKPSDYKAGQRYPLVIQTHGFDESAFEPAGHFQTAFAARALAAAGIVVLQVLENCHMETPSEGPCVVSGYEAGANQLVSEGVVDPEKIGIIGFSRTCFHVLEALTTSTLHFKAASITDGVTMTYFEYLLDEDPTRGDDDIVIVPVIGAKPFGEGLQQWLKRSPGFNLDKVTAPLLVVGLGSMSLFGMWEPYAGLRYLHKPVDLIMLNMGKSGLPYEHELTNPAFRLASQGGSVDWFRFWLQDYEDPDPAKAEQYTRWRELWRLQAENNKNE